MRRPFGDQEEGERGWVVGKPRQPCPRSGRDRSPASAPDSPARSASASWRVRPARCGWYGGQGREQEFGGLGFRAAIRSGTFLGSWRGTLVVPMGGRTGPAAKRDASGAFVPLAPGHPAPGALGQPCGEVFGGDGLVICATADPAGRAAAPAPGLDRQRHSRAAPTECLPCLGKPVSSMIQAWIGPCCSIAGSTRNGPRRAPPHHESCARKSLRRRGVH